MPFFGVHGVSHWARVLENGMMLAEETGAHVKVVQLFSVLHDSKRLHEAVDPGHGVRAAAFAESLRGSFIHLVDHDFELLYRACANHTKGLQEDDATVQTCYDADRLDLARASIYPSPDRLCTGAAKKPEVIDWAVKRSLRDHTPELIFTEWMVARP
ncbi:MAG: hypothetical protein GTO14_15425 [Anaerolineales bacterium]|nr:hypothetical protein [Anaerolineales bacterium]